MWKKRIWKRAGALVLSAALLFGAFPTGAAATGTGEAARTEEASVEQAEEAESYMETAGEPEDPKTGAETDAEGQSGLDAEAAKTGAEGQSAPAPETSGTDGADEEAADTGAEGQSGTVPETDGAGREDAEDSGTGTPEDESGEPEPYHFTEGDVASVLEWKERYFPDGYGDLSNLDGEWLDGLYDYERELVEFLESVAPDLSEEAYLGQDVETCIGILESGVPAELFFAGTVFSGLGLSELYELRDAGMELSELPVLLSDPGSSVARLQVSYTGHNGTGHGKIYKLVLGGQPAFCLSAGKAARSGYLYKADEGEYETKTDGLGMLISQVSVGADNYVCVQIAVWLYQSSEAYTQEQVRTRAAAMLDISAPQAAEEMAQSVWEYYRQALNGSAVYYVYHSDNDNAQSVGLKDRPEIYGGGTPPEVGPSEDTVVVKITKADWQTEVGLQGCMVELYENGQKIAVLTTDENGEAVYRVKKSPEEFADATYVYSVRETEAPDGYVLQEEELSKEGTAGETLEFLIANERTLGAAELIKYDTESESGTRQGDASLDGAEYGIYAAEDIVHQDGLTGVLYAKDELVEKAVVGRSPKQDGDGYVLNTDGSRHIENRWGEIAYEETPGRTLFGDLELGSYYIREIRPSEGYMLDEAVYEATFTYKDQEVTVEARDETAGEADNELTADDGSGSDTVYSGDYVIKQGIEFIKTSDNTYQTELEVVEGAGFSVYLVSGLSGVRDGSIRPAGGAWGEADIMTFYDYDFTEESTAVVYKRTGHERWTEGDRRWLVKEDGLNRYRVAEMFTDKNGRIITPELPYGTYVFVETTTPEHHTAAKPFLVYITQDGGVLYTDDTKQRIEKAYTPEDGIRYGDHEATKEREGRELQKQRIINNTITKSFLRLVKADEEFLVQPGAYIKAEEAVRGTVFKEGASYRLRCLSMELSEESLLALNWKYDGEGFMSYYDPNAKEMTGTGEKPFRPVFLRKDGRIVDCYITLPQEVPVGTYELTELTAPSGYVVNGSEQTVEDTGEGRVNGYEIRETPREKTVFTISNSTVYPDGQMGTDKYAVCDSYGNLTVTVLQKNQEQKGIIEIYKHGEHLAGVGADMEFVYEDAPVEGARFQIVAAENIYMQELSEELFLQYAADPKDYLIYKKGDVVAGITTDRNGWGYASGLYIGTYRIVETTAGDGFVLNMEVQEFEITPQEQTVSFQICSAEYENERQKLKLEVEKRDRENGNVLAGAVFGLYAAEDIRSRIVKGKDGAWTLRDEPATVVRKGTLIDTCVTGTDGRAVFEKDLPLAEYEIRELDAPSGYLGALEAQTADAGYDGPKGGQYVRVQSHRIQFENQITQTVVTKKDLTGGQELEGATLEVREIETDEQGNLVREGDGWRSRLVETWVSEGPGRELHYFYEKDGCLEELDSPSKLPEQETLIMKEGHLIKGLRTDRTYLLRETVTAPGYRKAEDMLFRLEQETDPDTGKRRGITQILWFDGTAWEQEEDGILVMYDERECVDVEKSAPAQAKGGEVFSFGIEEIRNLTDGPLDSFTVTDTLPEQVCLLELQTGTYDQELLYTVEYRLAGSGQWTTWREQVSTKESVRLQAPELPEGSRIDGFRLCFGTVEGGFGRVEKPVYTVQVQSGASGTLVNRIGLTAEQNGVPTKDWDETRTEIPGGGSKRTKREEPQTPHTVPEPVESPHTGDPAPLAALLLTASASASGIWFWDRRRRKQG
ncbi:MAG: SpaA isopeptide-forming pilin-related protein [Eubacteriales bacterium]|nr:SpaA isopeptide-forming pilin-related protein [Eubacteriales bacterium]